VADAPRLDVPRARARGFGNFLRLDPDAVGFAKIRFDGRHVLLMPYGGERRDPGRPRALVLGVTP